MNIILKNSASILIVLLVFICLGGTYLSWSALQHTYLIKNTSRFNQRQMNLKQVVLKQEYPDIAAKNMRIPNNKSFDIREHVQANDAIDGDLTKQIQFFGSVDVTRKKIYAIRCYVQNSQGLGSEKTIQIIVY